MRHIHVAAWRCPIANSTVIAGHSSSAAEAGSSRVCRIRATYCGSRKASRWRRHGGALSANDRCPAGPGVHGANGGHPAQFVRRNADVIARDLLRIHQRASRNCGEAVRRVHIGITDIVVRAISAATRAATVAYVSVVVHIRYVHVGDARIRDVHAIEIAATHVIPGNIRFTKTERAPAVAESSAEADANTPATATKPRHQRGRIVRPRINWTRRPSPGSAPINPTPVVKRSVSPWLIFHPGPSPRRNPNPVSVAVGRPPNRNSARNPDRAIVSRFLPGSVFVKVFRSRDIGRDISRGLRVVHMLIA
jgi:hypothetical protein